MLEDTNSLDGAHMVFRYVLLVNICYEATFITDQILYFSALQVQDVDFQRIKYFSTIHIVGFIFIFYSMSVVSLIPLQNEALEGVGVPISSIPESISKSIP